MYNDEEIEAIKRNVNTAFLCYWGGPAWDEERLKALNLIDALVLECRSLRASVVRQEGRISYLVSEVMNAE